MPDKKYYWKHKQELLEYDKRYRQKNHRRLIRYNKNHNAKPERKKYMHNRFLKNRNKLREITRNSRKENPKLWKKYYKRSNKNLRMKALEIVGRGNIACSNCGCKDLRILEINHLNGRKRDEMKFGKIPTAAFYRNIVKGRRKINDLNILCKICNWAYFVKKKYGINFEIKVI
jgi:hypothetical protein